MITKVIIFLWCRRRDLNPHGFPHTPLKRARIPIPPRRHRYFSYSIVKFSTKIYYHKHIFCKRFADEGTRTPMSFLART